MSESHPSPVQQSTAGTSRRRALGNFLDRIDAWGREPLISPRPVRQAAPPPQGSRPNVFRWAVFAVVVFGLLIGIGALFTLINPLMPLAAAREATAIDTLFNFMLGIAAAIFLLVQITLLYLAIRYRRRSGDNEDGDPIEGNNALEIVWTVIPAAIVLTLAILSYRTFVNVRTAGREALVIEVTGRQFQWQFYYPEEDVRTVDVLRVPANRPINFRLTSQDMVHSFWVPNFRLKRDAMPGMITDMWVTATAVGKYPIVCAELCGAGHDTMRGSIEVVSRTDFSAWVEAEKTKAVDTSDPIAYGRSLFVKHGCSGCHTLTDAKAVGQIGPNLDGIGSRADRDFIHHSIVNPNAVITEKCPTGPCQANLMPQNFGQILTEAELNALVTYLYSQK
ncbi:MAG: cytochrome c oxidase subunit II [Anaerolineae bacterium]|nr:cytochrome c oxidase subunit II [Anaerolineae bacterium]